MKILEAGLSLIKNFHLIGRIRKKARKLRDHGLEINLAGKSSPRIHLATSRLKVIRFSFGKGKPSHRIIKIDYFLKVALEIIEAFPVEERPAGLLHLTEAVEQFLSATSELSQSEKKELEKILLLESIICNLDSTTEKALAAKYEKLMQIVIAQNKEKTLRELCQFIVETARKSFGVANPSMMLYEEDAAGQYLVPYAIAMPQAIIDLGQRLRNKNLGEHRIPISSKSKNFYVQNFLEEREVVKLKNISKSLYLKIAGDFIDAEIEENGKFWSLFQTVFALFPKGENNVLMIPLKVEAKKIGILAILRKTPFSVQELREVKLFSGAAASVILAKQNNRSLIQYAGEKEQAVKRLEQMQDVLIKRERLAAIGDLSRSVIHFLKNISHGGVGLNYEFADIIEQCRTHLNLINLKIDKGMPIAEDFKLFLSRLDDLAKQLKLDEELWERVAELSRNILNLSKSDHGKADLVPLRKFLYEKIDTFMLKTKKKGIRFEINCSLSETDAVLIAEAELLDLLLNLIINASEAFDENSAERDKYIELSAHCKTDNEVVLAVSDNGCGIPKELQDRLFVDFLSTKKDGTGVGLISVYKIIQRYNGRIEIISPILKNNSGTKIELVLPRRSTAVSQKPLPETSALLNREETHTTKIWVIDDEELPGKATELILKKSGFNVERFSKPQDALSVLRECIKNNKEELDMIISDLTMPDISGEQFLSQVADLYDQQGINPKPIFVIYSGYAKPDSGQVCETIDTRNIRWVIKGQEPLAEICSKLLHQDGRESALPLNNLNLPSEYKTNPYYRFASLIVHKFNNLLHLLGFLKSNHLYDNSKDNSLKLVREGVKGLLETYNKLSEFVAYSKESEFEIDGINILLGELLRQQDLEIVWAPIKFGQRSNLAVVSALYIREFEQNLPLLLKARQKNIWQDDDLQALKRVALNLNRLNQAALLSNETFSEIAQLTQEFKKTYVLLNSLNSSPNK